MVSNSIANPDDFTQNFSKYFVFHAKKTPGMTRADPAATVELLLPLSSHSFVVLLG